MLSNTLNQKLNQAFGLIQDASRSQDMAKFRRSVLEALGQNLDAERSIFMHQVPKKPAPDFSVRNLDQKSLTDYLRYYFQKDPLKILAGAPGACRVSVGPVPGRKVVSLCDTTHHPSFLRSEYYNEFLRPQRIYRELGSFLNAGGGICGYIGLFRTQSERDFSPDEIRIFNLLSNYVSLAVENLHLRFRINGRRFFARQSQDRPGSGLDGCFGLSPREIEVVMLILEGLKNAEIAGRLFISEVTVKKHVQHICAKMGVSTRTAVLRKALESQGVI